jgi:hypothetical protein
MLFANDRFFENHWGTTPTLETNKKPIPKPNAKPCDRNRCQISDAHDAPKSPAVSNATPMNRATCVPYFRTHIVARGEIIRAIEIESPPTKAYLRLVAPGNVFACK